MLTTEPSAGPGPERSARQITEPLREPAALVLLAATAVLLFTAAVQLLPERLGEPVGERIRWGFGGFVNLATVLLPLLAVLLATHVRPVARRASLITTVALVEYAVAGFFGTVFGLLVGVPVSASSGLRSVFVELLSRVAWLAMLGLAGYAVFELWRGLYRAQRSSAAPPAGAPYPYPGPAYPGPAPRGYPHADAPAYGPPPGGAYGSPAGGAYGPPGAYGSPSGPTGTVYGAPVSGPSGQSGPSGTGYGASLSEPDLGGPPAGYDPTRAFGAGPPVGGYGGGYGAAGTDDPDGPDGPLSR